MASRRASVADLLELRLTLGLNRRIVSHATLQTVSQRVHEALAADAGKHFLRVRLGRTFVGFVECSLAHFAVTEFGGDALTTLKARDLGRDQVKSLKRGGCENRRSRKSNQSKSE